MERISTHYSRDRRLRESIIREVGEGNVIGEFFVDRGHVNGPEIHKVTDNAMVLIYNARTGRLITKLIASRNHIGRYWWAEGRKAPRDVMAIAGKWEKLGYHLI